MDSATLPEPSANQAYCTVSALEAGFLDFPLYVFLEDATLDQIDNRPSLAFLIQHSVTGKKFVFDLGIRKDITTLPPAAQQWIAEYFPCNTPQDVVESLQKGNVQASDVDYVLVSHIHWDHIGDPSPFTKATFLSGEGARALLDDGYPQNPASSYPKDLFPADRTNFLSPEDWEPVGPFPKAWDFFGDGSMYIINSAGHLPGHLTVLVRNSNDGSWLYLAADSAHDWRLVTGESKIAYRVDLATGVTQCIHMNKELAEVHIGRIRKLMELPRVQVILGHDDQWYGKHKNGPSYWPGKIESL